MLKEISIIFGTIGCIFLIIPLYGATFTSGPLSLSIPLLLLASVLIMIFLTLKNSFMKIRER